MFCKQKTAYELRISDWSSDVCSSYLQDSAMLGSFAKTIFGSSNDRYVKSLGSTVNKINAFEPAISAMSEDDLKHQTLSFRERIEAGERLDDLLPEAFATVREAAKRSEERRDGEGCVGPGRYRW